MPALLNEKRSLVKIGHPLYPLHLSTLCRHCVVDPKSGQGKGEFPELRHGLFSAYSSFPLMIPSLYRQPSKLGVGRPFAPGAPSSTVGFKTSFLGFTGLHGFWNLDQLAFLDIVIKSEDWNPGRDERGPPDPLHIFHDGSLQLLEAQKIHIRGLL